MRGRREIAIAMVLFLLLGIIGIALAASKANAQTPTTSGDKITFTLGLTSDMVSANPFKACCGAEYEMFFLNYDMLYNFSKETLQPEAALAEYPPTHSADGKTWTFKIRSGVKWSDGVPLTAHDIAFTYNFINEKELASFNDYLGFPIAKDAFEAPDDTTLIWHMDTPTLSPLTPPWIPIVPEHIWGKYMDPKYTAKDIKEVRNVPAVGSGPFHLTEWKEGQYWKMEANKGYWMGAPKIDEVVFRVYDSAEALKLALVNGEVDAAEALPPSIFNSLQNEPNITMNIANAGYMDNLAFNFEGTANPALQDEKVRDAIALAIDRQALVDRVTLGYGSVGTSIILPSYFLWHWEPTGSDLTAYNPQAAGQLLDSAGYKDTNGDGIREDKNGDPLSLEVLTISDVTYSVPEGKLIVGWLKDIGIDATIKTVSEGKAYDLWGAQDFDMYVWGWGGDPDPDFMLSIFTSKQCLSWSDGCWSDDTYDQMYLEQKTLLDEAKRQELVTQMQQYIYDKNPEIALLYENDLQAYRNDRFTGFIKQPQPQGAIFIAFGPWSYLNIEPVDAGSTGDGGSGSTGIPPLVWAGIAVLVIIIVGAVAMSRRGKGSEDTE
jgi:peptide/nickel transport system substrate-binding protein